MWNKLYISFSALFSALLRFGFVVGVGLLSLVCFAFRFGFVVGSNL
jgi:hypothetical protein